MCSTTHKQAVPAGRLATHRLAWGGRVLLSHSSRSKYSWSPSDGEWSCTELHTTQQREEQEWEQRWNVQKEEKEMGWKMYREKFRAPAQWIRSLIYTQDKNSPVGFRLFALTVDQPQVILGLFWTGLRVQVPHTDRLVWRRHIGQSRCWTNYITQCRMWGGIHHKASNGWLVSCFCCLWRKKTGKRGVNFSQDLSSSADVCEWLIRLTHCLIIL